MPFIRRPIVAMLAGAALLLPVACSDSPAERPGPSPGATSAAAVTDAKSLATALRSVDGVRSSDAHDSGSTTVYLASDEALTGPTLSRILELWSAAGAARSDWTNPLLDVYVLGPALERFDLRVQGFPPLPNEQALATLGPLLTEGDGVRVRLEEDRFQFHVYQDTEGDKDWFARLNRLLAQTGEARAKFPTDAPAARTFTSVLLRVDYAVPQDVPLAAAGKLTNPSWPDLLVVIDEANRGLGRLSANPSVKNDRCRVDMGSDGRPFIGCVVRSVSALKPKDQATQDALKADAAAAGVAYRLEYR